MAHLKSLNSMDQALVVVVVAVVVLVVASKDPASLTMRLQVRLCLIVVLQVKQELHLMLAVVQSATNLQLSWNL